MIKINRIEEPIIEILIGDTQIGLCYNETEFLDLLVQIKENKVNYFSCRIFGIENSEKYRITSSGRTKLNPYEHKNNLLSKLVGF